MDTTEKIILYGAGNRCRVLVGLMDSCDMPIGHVVDSNEKLWGSYIDGHIIESPDLLSSDSDARICITATSFLALAEIRKRIKLDYNVDDNREISYYNLILNLFEKIDIGKLFQPEQVTYLNHVSVIFDCEFGLGLGGIEEWTKGICKEFVKKGDFSSYILTNYGDYDIPKELTNHIIRVDVERDNAFSLNNMKQILNCISRYLPCILVTSQPDEVLLAGKILSSFFGEQVKVVTGIRGGYPEINKSYIDMESCTDLYVCVNSAIRKDMIKRGIGPDRIFTMLCPVECSEHLNRTYSTDPSFPVRIGNAGRLEIEEKRMDLLLKMISELEKMQVNYYLELAGDGRYEKVMHNYIEQNNLHEKVKLLGRINKNLISKFWSGKDICINISDHEGRSRSTVEAMANGAIPVVTETWGVHDDITDGQNGYIFNVGDYKKAAEKIALLAKERALLPEMGRLAHLEIRKKSSMEEHYQFWQNIISIVRRSCT